MAHKIYSRSFSRYIAMLGILLLLAASFSTAAVQPALAQDEEAEVSVTLEAIPGIRVARGTILAYKMRIYNHGDATMAYARLYLPYDQSKYVLVDTQFDHGGDFVEAIEPDKIQVYIDDVGKDYGRFAVLYFYVLDHLPDNTVINMWVDYDWEDRRGNYDLDERSNAAPVLVGGSNETSNYVWMTVDQAQGPIGTTFRFFSDRFIPGEEVRAYLKYPSGREIYLGDEHTADADPSGRIHVHFDSSTLNPASYQMLLRGEKSDLEAITSFTALQP